MIMAELYKTLSGHIVDAPPFELDENLRIFQEETFMNHNQKWLTKEEWEEAISFGLHTAVEKSITKLVCPMPIFLNDINMILGRK